MLKIALIGSNGQLGSDILEVLKEENTVFPLTHRDIEISDKNSVKGVLGEIKPEVVINTAAFHHVPRCEREPERAFVVNALGARNLAEVCGEINAVLYHISTDYVFDGKKRSPYIEEDTPRPLNAYGITKLAGEHFIQAIWEKHYILRVSGLYGRVPCRAKGGRNFVFQMIKLAKEKGKVRVVDDEVLTPTHTLEVARQIKRILKEAPPFGIYHATAEGQCSWYEFARAIFDISGIRVNLEKAFPGEFSAGVLRPKYSVLENRRLKELGINIFKHWRDALEEFLRMVRV